MGRLLRKFWPTFLPVWLPSLVPGVSIPDIGVRVTILVIVAFLLVVGGALIGLRIMELREEADSVKTKESRENK